MSIWINKHSIDATRVKDCITIIEWKSFWKVFWTDTVTDEIHYVIYWTESGAEAFKSRLLTERG